MSEDSQRGSGVPGANEMSMTSDDAHKCVNKTMATIHLRSCKEMMLTILTFLLGLESQPNLPNLIRIDKKQRSALLPRAVIQFHLNIFDCKGFGSAQDIK